MHQSNVPQLRFKKFIENWINLKLIDVAPLQRGFDLPVPKINRGDYPVVFSNGVLKTHNKYKVKGSGVVTGRSGTIGKVFFIEKSHWPHNTSLWVTDFFKNDKKFIFYLYNCINLKRYSAGSTVPTLNRNDVHNVKCLIPEINEQNKIASFLSAVDSKIEKLTRKKELLEEYKKGVMQKLFSGEIRFKDDNGNDYPDWDYGNFSKYIKLYRGSSPRPIVKYITKDNEGVNWIKIGDSKNSQNYQISSVSEKITYEGTLKSRKVEKGELILANSMSFGKTYLINLNGCIYDGWFVLREYKQSFIRAFLHQLLNSDLMQRQYKRLSVGGVVQNINSDIVYNTKLFVPCISEQKKIASFISTVDSKTENTSSKIVKTKEFKKGLLQQMFM
jgi:type I restriction enzyme, S subunit